MEKVRSCLFSLASWAGMSTGVALLGVAVYFMVMGAAGEGVLVDWRVLVLSAFAGVLFSVGGLGIMGVRPWRAPMLGQATAIVVVITAGVMQSVQLMAAGYPGYGILALVVLTLGGVVLGIVVQLRYNKLRT